MYARSAIKNTHTHTRTYACNTIIEAETLADDMRYIYVHVQCALCIPYMQYAYIFSACYFSQLAQINRNFRRQRHRR